MKCPNCGSGNTKKSSAMHQQAGRYDGASTGWWITSRGTVGVGKRRSQGRRTSDALEANAPPSPSPLTGCAASIPIIAMFLLAMTGWLPLWLLLIFGFGGAVAMGVWAYASEKPDLDRRATAYDRQWYCFKCGSIFETEDRSGRVTQASGGAVPTSHESVGSTPRYGRREYIDRVLAPIQRAGRPTVRDEGGLAEIVRRSIDQDNKRVFEPTGMDKGIVSRLASLDFIAYDPEGDVFYVTPAGLAQAGI